MKKGLSILLLAFLLMGTLVYVAAPAVNAQTSRTRVVRTHRRHRTFWQKHRDKLTLGASTAAGAGIGAIAGGKKGAAIGSLAGAGGGALYTYKLRKRHRHYHRRY
jgi:hypothetical protein